jgi:xanthine dehydrogenase molybdopterin-binding subunit B
MAEAGYDQGFLLNVNVEDGTVCISHGGCEIGQGINTKVVQAVALELSVDMSLIAVACTR